MWTLTRRDITTISRPRKETQGVCWTGCHSPQGTGFSLACQEGLARGLLPGASLPSLWSLSPARIPRLVHLGLCCPALSPLTLARWQLQTPQAMHLPCRPCCHQTTGEGPGLYYISLLLKTPPTSLARGALQPSPLHWVLEFPGLAGSRPWRRCRQVYQSSSCCLTAGARLPASQWLEFQPFSLLNTSWALPPTHNKFLSSPASWQCSPGPPTWGHSAPSDRQAAYLPGGTLSCNPSRQRRGVPRPHRQEWVSVQWPGPGCGRLCGRQPVTGVSLHWDPVSKKEQACLSLTLQGGLGNCFA